VLGSYPSLDALQREVDAATARVGRARSGYWPRIDVVGTYRRQDPVGEFSFPAGIGGPGDGDGDRSVSIQPNNLYDGHLQARQTLYDFGKTRARIDRAEAGRAAARRRVDVERADIAFAAVRSFYATLLAEARIAVQRDQIRQLKQNLAVVRRQNAAGTATEFEIQSTRTRLSAAQSQLTRFQSERQRQAAELRRLLGREPGESLTLSGSITPRLTAADTARIDPGSLTEWSRLRHHPSAEVAEARVEAARRQVRVADRSDAPTLTLDAQGGVKNGYPDDLNEPRVNEAIGLSFRVPLFEGFATRRDVEEAEAQMHAAEARLSDVRRQLTMQVEQAAADLRARLSRLTSTEMQVEQARAAAQLARTRYKAGTITNLELLDAETSLQEARLERTVVQYQVVLGRYALQRAAGTLLPLNASLF
jgi:outer membrane protein TolC